MSPAPLLYILALEPLFHRLRDEEASLALRGFPLTGPLSAKVSAFADDITVFVSRYVDIKAVKKAITRYEQIAGAKINWYERRFASRCLEEWCSPAMAFQME